MAKDIETIQRTESAEEDDMGFSGLPLCREPWESYYILRRGILPCCFGNPIEEDMSNWSEPWNSPQLQEIRDHLSRGKLSPYCRSTLCCPIVQRVLLEKEGEIKPFRHPLFLRLVNRVLFRLPGRIYKALRRR